MRRFWVDDPDWQGEDIVLSGDIFHHIHDVCRFTVGNKFELLTKDGVAHFVEITQMSKRDLRARRHEQRPIPPLPKPHIHLALSIPRFQKIDWIVEKSVELGVKSIHLFVSDYSFVRQKTGLPASKLKRWEKMTRQAAQQAGRGDLLELAPVSTLSELLNQINRRPKVLGLFPYEGSCDQSVREHLKMLPERNLDEVWLFVGSEGGFSKSEVDRFAESGLNPLSFGEQILRVETACLALVSVIKYEFEVRESRFSLGGFHGSV